MKRTREEAIEFLIKNNIEVHEYSIKNAMGNKKDNHYIADAFQVQNRWYTQEREY